MSSDTITGIIGGDHAKYMRRKNTDGFRLKYSLGHSERKELVKEVGVNALVLFEYYLRLASTENTVINDTAAADYFSWSAASAKRHRLSLVNAGWMAVEKARLGNGRKIIVYYLGKDEVRAAGLAPKDAAREIRKPTIKLIK